MLLDLALCRAAWWLAVAMQSSSLCNPMVKRIAEQKFYESISLNAENEHLQMLKLALLRYECYASFVV